MVRWAAVPPAFCISKIGGNYMKHQIITVGLKDELLSLCRSICLKKGIKLNNVLSVSEAIRILEREKVQLLILDMEFLRGIGQSEWIVNIRYVSFIPIVVLTDIPEADIDPAISAGVDVCYDSKLPDSMIALLLLAQLRRYTEYNHFENPKTVPFQVGDIAIDPSRRLVWVRGQQIDLRPREFNLLLYFMKNPNIVLTAEQICENAWNKDYLQSVTQSIYDLRQKIEADPSNPIYVRTVCRVGYRFTGYYDGFCDN